MIRDKVIIFSIIIVVFIIINNEDLIINYPNINDSLILSYWNISHRLFKEDEPVIFIDNIKVKCYNIFIEKLIKLPHIQYKCILKSYLENRDRRKFGFINNRIRNICEFKGTSNEINVLKNVVKLT